MKLRPLFISAALALPIFATISADAQKQVKPAKPVPVPETAPAEAREQPFVDKHYKVRFTVPKGWEVARKDGQVSTFHLDARSAPAGTKLRGIAMLDFNPYAYSTLAGALFYYSVEPNTTDVECSAQATVPSGGAENPGDFASAAPVSTEAKTPEKHKDVQDVAGIPFAHGHDEHGQVCIEARDEVYTAWHKRSCYRFDLAMNTFCPEASGAQPISLDQIRSVDQRMTDILSTVTFGWEHSEPHPISAPDVPEPMPSKKLRELPSSRVGAS